MPYKSMSQMKYMHKEYPKIAKKYDAEYGHSKKYPKSLKSTMSDMAKKRRT